MVTASSHGPLERDDIDQLMEAVHRVAPFAQLKEMSLGMELRIVITDNEDGTYTAWTYD